MDVAGEDKNKNKKSENFLARKIVQSHKHSEEKQEKYFEYN